MTTDRLINENNSADRRKPTRRSLLNALATLPAAGAIGIPIATARAAVPPETSGVPTGAPSALWDLHRRWSEIEEELRLLWPQISERAIGAKPAVPQVNVKVARGILCSAEEIDAKIDERLAGAPTRRQAAALERQRTRLKVELEEARAARRERKDQLGITALEHRAGILSGEVAALCEAMQREPASSSIEDVAMLFDLALYEATTVPHRLSFSSQFGVEFPWLARLMRHLRALAPDIELAVIRRSMPSSRTDVSYGEQFAWICAERSEANGDDSPEDALGLVDRATGHRSTRFLPPDLPPNAASERLYDNGYEK